MVSCEGKPDCGCFRCYAAKIKEQQQQQQQQAKRMSWSEAITGVAAVVGVVGVALVGLGVNYLLSDSSSSSGKTMIAPGTGRAIRILRDGFEDNPAKYFRDLRKK